MTSERVSNHRVSPAEAVARLGGIEWLNLAGAQRRVALPDSYARKKSRRYPLLMLVDDGAGFGSATEMSRLMAQTGEIRECIVCEARSAAEAAALAELCRARLRVQGEPALFAPAADLAGQPLRGLAADAAPGARLPSLVDGLRGWLATGKRYGDNVVPAGKPLVLALLRLLAPLFKPPAPVAEAGNRHLFRAQALDRNFEIFAQVPESAARDPQRRYPALLALDANIEFCTVAETAARLAAAGAIPELIVIGIGTPRSEGAKEFGFRRFEELSPPADGYLCDDELGRIFRSLFSLRGQDARERLGRAPDFHRFLVGELLPRLAGECPIDLNDLGLLGHSAGGTFVGYSLFQPDAPYSKYIGISPGVAVSGRWLMRPERAKQVLPPAAKSAFFCLGGEERVNAFNVIAGIPDTEAFAGSVRRHGLAVESRCYDNETHSSVFARAVSEALVTLYGTS